MWGAGFIAGNVKSDFACLNRMEMLPWDLWGESVGAGPFDPVPEGDVAILDELCELVATDDLDAMRARYASDDRLRVPADTFTMVDGQPVAATVAVD